MATGELTRQQTATLVIGIGNPYRGDDGAGPTVARALQQRGLPDTIVKEASGEGAALMEAWADAEKVILIDAAQAGNEPGTIYRFDARTTQLPVYFFNYSSHAFSLAEAVELGRILGCLPRQLVVYGIEGQDYSAGEGLTPPVTRAVRKVVAQIAQEIEAMRRSATCTNSP